jgi:hypothetical protein
MFRLAALLALCLAASAYAQQGSTRIRASVQSFDGRTLVVKTAIGKEIRLAVNEKTGISYPRLVKLADIKEGDFVGSAAMPGPDGKLVAREVHVFPEAQRGLGEGHREWDEPGSTMTNGAVSKSARGVKGQELTVAYKGGTQTIVVPEGTTVVTNLPGDKSLLVPGSYVIVQATIGADGTVTAQRIQATSKDGVKPPM